MPRVSVDVGYVDVDVDLDDFDVDDLIGELENRGYEVLESDDPILKDIQFKPNEIRAMINLIDGQNPIVGSELYFIREELIRSC
jgi:hypothetical protein